MSFYLEDRSFYLQARRQSSRYRAIAFPSGTLKISLKNKDNCLLKQFSNHNPSTVHLHEPHTLSNIILECINQAQAAADIPTANLKIRLSNSEPGIRQN